MLRNCEKRYNKDIDREMKGLKKLGLDTDGTVICEEYQKIRTITLAIGKCWHIHSSLMVNATGGVVAIATRIVYEDNSVEPAIITDLFYDELSKAAKKYILTHEEGHMIYGHNGTDEDAIKAVASGAEPNLNGRKIEHEYQADEYAARKIGKRATLKAMREFGALMKKNAWTEFDDQELINRIEHLQSTAI